MGVESMVYSDSMSPTFLCTFLMLFQIWQVRPPTQKAQPDVYGCQIFPAYFPDSFTQVSKTHGRMSLQNISLPAYRVSKWCFDVRQQNTTWVKIKETIFSNPTYPGATVIAHVGIEVSQSPVEALSSNPRKDTKKAGYFKLLFDP